MLQLKHIKKTYVTGTLTQHALKDVSLNFRSHEFVAILGQSGSGKTTLLNIIGGLDRYDSGDLMINGISTKDYEDRDWDAYRNHTIGFVFQSYNLIPHQSILSNVELALTISGISDTERKQRASEALEKVGLGDQLHKRPNQMSGGQMQRVAIARALVNNPDILLADEPTGALDTETSIQVMNLLKEVSQDRLVIMVTHNPELAAQYATRIVKVSDGEILDDSDPYDVNDVDATAEKPKRHARMSFMTALSLSFNNLLTKKTRTFLTAFAGSIGIIGIALILSLSSGMQSYIHTMQQDTLSTYPLEIEKESVDISGMMTSMMGNTGVNREDRESSKVYSSNIMGNMMTSLSAQTNKNDLEHFKKYLTSDEGKSIMQYVNTVQYSYNLDLMVYRTETADGIVQVNPSDIFGDVMGRPSQEEGMPSGMGSFGQTQTFVEMIDNKPLLQNQYDVLAGRWPESKHELLLVVDEHQEISDATLYTLGILDQKDLEAFKEAVKNGTEIEAKPITSYAFDDLLNLDFKLVLNTDVYEKEGDVWVNKQDKEAFMKPVIDQGLTLNIVGIVKPNEEVTAASLNGNVAYLPELTQYVIDSVADSDIVKAQLASPDTSILTDMPFDMEAYLESLTMADMTAYIGTLPQPQQAQMSAMVSAMDEASALALFKDMMKDQAGAQSTLDGVLNSFGYVDVDRPTSIKIYPKDFEAKDEVVKEIEAFNVVQKNAGHEDYVIHYTDIMAIMMSSVTSIINIITYVLISFVGISLVVSSIMIAIITYISVLERTKEIGILRSIGASKKDISRVFNAETVIEGFAAGILGVLITVLLNIPINAVIKSMTGVSGIASLPIISGVILILLSIFLTWFAGLIPARMAAKKDPVEALRSE